MPIERHDRRKLDHETLEAIRIRAVEKVQAGQSPEVVIKALGFSRACIYEWLARYREGGWDALRARPIPGRPRRLNEEQIRWIYETAMMKNPLQLKFPSALWTRVMIVKLIRKRFGVELSAVSVSRLLAQLGITSKQYVDYYEQNRRVLKRWLEEEYPQIHAEGRQIGAEIYFGDEVGLRFDGQLGTTSSPGCPTATATTAGQRFGSNMLSAISPNGRLRFMVVKGRVNEEQVCEFIRRLMYRAKRPVFLILDGHPLHKSRLVAQCVKSYSGNLRLFLLPPLLPGTHSDR